MDHDSEEKRSDSQSITRIFGGDYRTTALSGGSGGVSIIRSWGKGDSRFHAVTSEGYGISPHRGGVQRFQATHSLPFFLRTLGGRGAGYSAPGLTITQYFEGAGI